MRKFRFQVVTMTDWASHFRGHAEANSFEMFFDGSLRACPKGKPTHPLLVVEPLEKIDGTPQQFKLIRHRTNDLTEQFANRNVSEDWIFSFLLLNRDVALRLANLPSLRSG